MKKLVLLIIIFLGSININAQKVLQEGYLYNIDGEILKTYWVGTILDIEVSDTEFDYCVYEEEKLLGYIKKELFEQYIPPEKVLYNFQDAKAEAENFGTLISTCHSVNYEYTRYTFKRGNTYRAYSGTYELVSEWIK